MNVRFRANLFGHVESLLKRLVEPTIGGLMLQSQLIGGLQLTKDLRFTQHHGIQAAGYFEQVLHRGLARVFIKDFIRITFHLTVLQYKRSQFVKQRLWFSIGRHIKLHSVASG